ncbi:hypothetical protein [Priestia megaterium]|uniref:hypothetical protein n=1 Tax=Priestia megaterium TaxID=1404 RepID=UPI000BFEA7B8|nr:hypothetical protein [Priestia megaterium]PGO60688.1 hypothetical protein CN981_09055 [Priestia megaterium]
MALSGFMDKVKVLFFNKDTGETFETEAINASIVKESDEVASIECESGTSKVTYEDTKEKFEQQHKELTLKLENPVFHAGFYTDVLGFNEHEDIARLDRIRKRTKKKRIQKKLDKRIVKMCENRPIYSWVK